MGFLFSEMFGWLQSCCPLAARAFRVLVGGGRCQPAGGYLAGGWPHVQGTPLRRQVHEELLPTKLLPGHRCP